MRFETCTLPLSNYQGNAVVNFTSCIEPYTRVIEHKHFEFGTSPATVISHEYPVPWKNGIEPMYPINNDENNALYQQYAKLAESHPNLYFGGRLGQYKYFDMDKVIHSSLCLANRLLSA